MLSPVCHRSSVLFVICLSFLMLAVHADVVPPLHNPATNKLKTSKQPLPPCQACKTLVNSFNKGLDRTARGKYEGGDAHWEESRLGIYADSELRLIEIQEKLCSELDRGQDQCHSLAEEHESVIEEWWFHKRKEKPDLHEFFCIEHLKVCCPENHYGPDCSPCKGGATNPCGGHGTCKGAGTRKGSGKCKCHEGYDGELCDKCAVGYYKGDSAGDGDALNCVKCHKSCKAHCREGGPKGCEVCTDGYQYTAEFGCLDVDECVESPTPPCQGNTFCVNTEGSHQCLSCDRSCEGCTGDGPDMCINCADGYFKKGKLCVESGSWRRELHVEVARYATYAGLVVATVILFQRNVLWASLIGLVVAVYIGFSEYTLGSWDKVTLDSLLKSWISV